MLEGAMDGASASVAEQAEATSSTDAMPQQTPAAIRWSRRILPRVTPTPDESIALVMVKLGVFGPPFFCDCDRYYAPRLNQMVEESSM
jgi:hypothetical protein